MAAFTGQRHRMATANSTRYAAGAVRPATCCRASIPPLRPACSSCDSGTPAGGSRRRRRQARPCLKELALQECQLHKATAYSLPAALHHALPAFVRKFVLRHPSAAQLLHEFDSTYLMVLQCQLPAKQGAAGEALPPAAADAPSTSRLLSALTPRQRAAAHLCRVDDDDVYFEVYLLAFAQGRGPIEYEDPWGWVTLLHVPPALRGQGLGRAMLDCLTKEFDCEPRVPASVLDSFEHWG